MGGHAISERCFHPPTLLGRWLGHWLQIQLYSELVRQEWHSTQEEGHDEKIGICCEPGALLETLHLFVREWKLDNELLVGRMNINKQINKVNDNKLINKVNIPTFYMHLMTFKMSFHYKQYNLT